MLSPHHHRTKLARIPRSNVAIRSLAYAAREISSAYSRSVGQLVRCGSFLFTLESVVFMFVPVVTPWTTLWKHLVDDVKLFGEILSSEIAFDNLS